MSRLLESGAGINIQYAPGEGSTYLKVVNNYPRDVATASSSFVRQQLQSAPETGTISIIANQYESVKRLFRAALDHCKGAPILDYLKTDEEPFASEHFDRATAVLLGMPKFVRALDAYMRSRLDNPKNVFTYDEVEAMWASNFFFTYRPTTGYIPGPEVLYAMQAMTKWLPDDDFATYDNLSYYVANATWADMPSNPANKNTERSGPRSSLQYIPVRREFPDFDADVNFEVERLWTEAREAEKAARAAEAKRREEARTVHKTLKLEKTRKSGKHNFHKLPLADVGVTEKSFLGAY